MRTKSIYLDNKKFVPKTLEDEIAFRASELRTCEQLITMGYNYSCNSNLHERAKELKSRISYLEDELKRKLR